MSRALASRISQLTARFMLRLLVFSRTCDRAHRCACLTPVRGPQSTPSVVRLDVAEILYGHNELMRSSPFHEI